MGGLALGQLSQAPRQVEREAGRATESAHYRVKHQERKAGRFVGKGHGEGCRCVLQQRRRGAWRGGDSHSWRTAGVQPANRFSVLTLYWENLTAGCVGHSNKL